MGIFDKQESGSQGQGGQQSGGGNRQSQSNDPFARVGGATPGQNSVYPVPGVYPLLFLDVMKMIQSRNGDDIFIAEFDILESSVDARPKGSTMSWVVNLRFDASPGNIKGFIAAIMGAEVDEVDADSAKYACSEKNPCHGRLVRLEASNIKTKEKGNDFTLCKWISIPEEMQAEAKALREAAGFPPF